ncbi:MAG: hypothetical protein HC896_01315 [Bacteroidales bacterium]|nr:hypothetical protein [Bacteroidales bacterium]
MKLRLFTNISHELRTPLTLILGPLHKLIETSHNNPKALSQLHIINTYAQRLLRLVNQLLDFRKIEFEGFALELKYGDLILFINNIYNSFHPLAVRQKIDYHFITSIKSYKVFF